jgi:hypothetical protein
LAFFSFFFFQWCFVLLIRGSTAKHQETRARLQWRLFRNWKELQVEHFLWAHELDSFIFGRRSLDAHVPLGFFLCFAPPPQRLGQSLALGHVEEYVHLVKALAPLALIFAS